MLPLVEENTLDEMDVADTDGVIEPPVTKDRVIDSIDDIDAVNTESVDVAVLLRTEALDEVNSCNVAGTVDSVDWLNIFVEDI